MFNLLISLSISISDFIIKWWNISNVPILNDVQRQRVSNLFLTHGTKDQSGYSTLGQYRTQTGVLSEGAELLTQ